jgi:hypothetical protein
MELAAPKRNRSDARRSSSAAAARTISCSSTVRCAVCRLRRAVADVGLQLQLLRACLEPRVRRVGACLLDLQLPRQAGEDRQRERHARRHRLALVVEREGAVLLLVARTDLVAISASGSATHGVVGSPAACRIWFCSWHCSRLAWAPARPWSMFCWISPSRPLAR